MSVTTLNNKIVTGSGDCIQPPIFSTKTTPKSKRKYQVPSSRKFGTPRYHDCSNGKVNHVLKETIEVLESKSSLNVTPQKKKALTIAEITPSKNRQNVTL